MSIEHIRGSVESFMQEISKTYYMQGAGINVNVEFSIIYQKYPGLFTENNLNIIKSHLSDTLLSSEDVRMLKMLLEAFYCELVSFSNSRLNTEFLKLEGNSKIQVEGELVPFRNSLTNLINEVEREKRKSIRNAIDEFTTEKLNPVLERIFINEWKCINDFGFNNKVDMFGALSGIDLYKLNELMQAFLKDTNDIYSDCLAKAAKEKMGLNIDDLCRDDLVVLMRAHRFDGLFTKDKMFDIVSSFIDRIGLDISTGGKIRFDMDTRENKSARAFCSPVKIPDEIYLVMQPAGGADDYNAFLHELGHALHLSNLSSSMPLEYKWYGDNSVSEAFAMTFDHLLMSPEWMSEYMGINFKDNKEYFTHKAMCELIALRGFAAKIEYEIKLNQTPELNNKPALYAGIFENIMKVKYPHAQYLATVDSYFYCARYTRAWMLQANIHAYMNSNFGNAWFTDKKAGDVLMNMWSFGQKYNADELSAMYGGNKLSTEPLLNNINNLLLN